MPVSDIWQMCIDCTSIRLLSTYLQIVAPLVCAGFLAQAHLIAARLSCGIPIASTQPLHVPRPYSNPGRR